MNGDELTGSDRGLLFMLAVCGELTYLEKRRIRALLMPQYVELICADGHPLNHRLMELKKMIEMDVKAKVNKAHQNQIKPNKRAGSNGRD